MIKNMKTRAQLGLAFATVVGLFAVTLMLVGALLTQLTQDVQQITQGNLPNLLVADEMDLSRSEVQQFLTDVSATHDRAGYEEAEAAAKRFRDGVEKFRRLYQRDKDAQSLRQLEALEADFERFYAMGKLMAETYIEKGMEAGNLLMKGSATAPGFDKASEELLEGVKVFRKQQVERAGAISATVTQESHTMRLVMVISGVTAALLAILFSSWIVRGILRQLGGDPREAARVAHHVGQGDLSLSIALRAGDSSSLMAQLKVMQERLGAVVAKVRQDAEGVADGSAEIAQGNQDLSVRTEQQAGALNKTAASMEELGTTVKQNADNARQASELAVSASAVAARGGEVVAQVVDTMRGINQSSRQIADITSVIDGIAFQTNILALNAAVEAARAGEQGRGFAVVASEVRSLAARSAEAAKQIKSLINSSVQRVEQGTVLVDQAGATMAEVVASIRRVTDIMGEISAASGEQAAGVAQVSEAVTQMDQVTQQNAALVEEIASAAESQKSRAQELVNTMSVFRLAGAAGQPAAAAHAALAY